MTYRAARAALEFQLAARKAASTVKGDHSLLHRRYAEVSGHEYRSRRLYDDSCCLGKLVEQRRYSTSCRSHAASFQRKPPQPAPRQGKSLLKPTAPAIQNNIISTAKGKRGSSGSNATEVPSSPSSPSPSPSTLSSRQGEEDPIFVLTHFRKPPPLIVRGLRWKKPGFQFLLIFESLRRYNPWRRPTDPKKGPHLGQGYLKTKTSMSDIILNEFLLLFVIMGVLIGGSVLNGKLSTNRRSDGRSGRDRKGDARVQRLKSEVPHHSSQSDGDRDWDRPDEVSGPQKS